MRVGIRRKRASNNQKRKGTPRIRCVKSAHPATRPHMSCAMCASVTHVEGMCGQWPAVHTHARQQIAGCINSPHLQQQSDIASPHLCTVHEDLHEVPSLNTSSLTAAATTGNGEPITEVRSGERARAFCAHTRQFVKCTHTMRRIHVCAEWIVHAHTPGTHRSTHSCV